tara:strand:- start:15932 stop:16273 length:342 start_codon:yes stop_codon:yes gene_type:complete
MAKFLPSGVTVDYKYRVSLEGDGYDIRTRWNNRSQSWYIYIGRTGRNPVLKTRAVVGRDLLAAYSNEDLPAGKLYVVDVEKGFGRPSEDDFGIDKRFRLLYVRSDEDDPILGG